MMLYTSMFYSAYEGKKKQEKTEVDEIKERVVELAEIERESITKIMRLEEQLNMYSEELKMQRYERMALEKVVMEQENKQLVSGLLKLRDDLEDHQILLCKLQQNVQNKATGKLASLWRPPQISADMSKSSKEQVDLLGQQLEEELQRILNIIHSTEVKPATISKKTGEKLLDKERQTYNSNNNNNIFNDIDY
ncbi:putative actin binding protein [Heterostelium album PN500]|uniref:Putative actin binding protein n=1 Tax=Heterostelium pallidum (strain ATCC 26659 / Pp 5 / PN500) TaxID=670386 RepID=D3BS01_HETP5|nr:putative actin binding protein [Heterostelium album PN500]EFA75738.1 putative actin binding protein [Heterostelium album PN500]|eukprot:XP_020427872.1 putative actin binding protein [Heterostelium album PN500]